MSCLFLSVCLSTRTENTENKNKTLSGLDSLSDLGVITSLDSRDGQSWELSASLPTQEIADHSLDPHDSHVMKYSRFSLPSSVSGDLQTLHVTYSTKKSQHLTRATATVSPSTGEAVLDLIHSPIYFLNTFSICFCVNRPFMINR